MRKSTSLCEFSTTPSVSLMRDKTGQNIGAGAQVPQKVQTNKQDNKPANTKPAPAQEDEDMFQLEGM